MLYTKILYKEVVHQRCSYLKYAANLQENNFIDLIDTSAWVFSCKFAAYFQKTFTREGGGRMREEYVKIYRQLSRYKCCFDHVREVSFHPRIIKHRRPLQISFLSFIPTILLPEHPTYYCEYILSKVSIMSFPKVPF